MNKKIIVIALGAMAFIACKNDENEKDTYDENTTVTDVEVELEEPTSEAVVYTKDEASAMQRDFEESVEVDQDGKVTRIKGWNVYTTVNDDILTLRKSTTTNRMTASQQLRSDFNTLKNSIPSYLNVRRVRRAIENVDEEITDVEDLSNNEGVSESRLNRNLDDISEAYDDLAEAIAKARQRYIENKEDAMEEYLEEVNDLDPNKTTTERYRDAREEYDEEMKQK